jgi:tetratricopeptide (TPR) repeat protein
MAGRRAAEAGIRLMDPTSVDWLPAVVVLAAGLALGVLATLRLRSAPRPAASLASAPPLEVRDLAAKRDALVRQLRELEDTAAKRTPEQLAEERYALELEAAGVLRDLEARPAAAAPRVESAAPAIRTAAPSALRGFLWGAGSMAALGALFALVWYSARPREEGGSLTGNLPGEAQGQAPVDAGEARLREALARNPDDLEARLDLARLYLSRQDMMAVFNETKYVLERSPGQPRALGYQALVRLAMGQSEMALDMLKQAQRSAPDYFEGYIHLMLAYVRMGRTADAEKTLAEATQRFPEQAEPLRGLLAQMKAEVPPEGASAATVDGDPHADVPQPPTADVPPVAAARSTAPPSAQAGRTLAVEVQLDPSLAGPLAPGTVLFVIVREAGMQKGPPRAVKRLVVSSFPVRLTLGDADSMAGEPLPAEARVEARADSDGDPMTRPASDPFAAQDGVKVGSGPVLLVLRR